MDSFGMGEKFNVHIKDLKPINICYTIEENVFNGNKNIQLLIKDIKVNKLIQILFLVYHEILKNIGAILTSVPYNWILFSPLAMARTL